jgi:anti-anti-sigma regulatory factor
VGKEDHRPRLLGYVLLQWENIHEVAGNRVLPGDQMDVTKDVTGGRMWQLDVTRVSVALVGEFDAYDLEPLCEVLDALLRSRVTACVDLSGVTFLDVGCARELATRSHLCGGRLTLRSPSWQAASSFRACGYGHEPPLPHPMTTPRTRTSDGRENPARLRPLWARFEDGEL